jgi:hypothetical protein
MDQVICKISVLLIVVFKLVIQIQLVAEMFFMKEHCKNKANFTLFR